MSALGFAMYASVGLAGTFVQYIVLFVVVSSGVAGPVIGSSLGAVAGAFVNYVLNYRFTFRSSARHGDVAPKFFLVGLFGLVVNALLMSVVLIVFEMNYLLAQCVASVGVLVVTFIINRLWTFKQITHPAQ